MTQDEIIEMAKQAGWQYADGESGFEPLWNFAKLVAAKAFQNGYEKGIAAFNEAVNLEREACGEAAMKAVEKAVDVAMKLEREACAKVAEQSFGVIGSTIALAIRAGGEA